MAGQPCCCMYARECACERMQARQDDCQSWQCSATSFETPSSCWVCNVVGRRKGSLRGWPTYYTVTAASHQLHTAITTSLVCQPGRVSLARSCHPAAPGKCSCTCADVLGSRGASEAGQVPDPGTGRGLWPWPILFTHPQRGLGSDSTGGVETCSCEQARQAEWPTQGVRGTVSSTQPVASSYAPLTAARVRRCAGQPGAGQAGGVADPAGGQPGGRRAAAARSPGHQHHERGPAHCCGGAHHGPGQALQQRASRHQPQGAASCLLGCPGCSGGQHAVVAAGP